MEFANQKGNRWNYSRIFPVDKKKIPAINPS